MKSRTSEPTIRPYPDPSTPVRFVYGDDKVVQDVTCDQEAVTVKSQVMGDGSSISLKNSLEEKNLGRLRSNRSRVDLEMCTSHEEHVNSDHKEDRHLALSYKVENIRLHVNILELERKNKTLEDKNSHLKNVTDNLKGLLFTVSKRCAFFEGSFQDYERKLSNLSRKVTFYGKKLEEYVVKAFNQAEYIKDLEFRLRKTIVNYETEINNLKLQLLAKPKSSCFLNYSYEEPPKFQQEVVTFEPIFRHKTDLNAQDMEGPSILDDFVRDKCRIISERYDKCLRNKANSMNRA